MPVRPSTPRLALAAIALTALTLVGASPMKRGNVTAYVRFEVANPVMSIDSLDPNPPVTDSERMMKSEAVRMIDDDALEAIAKERVVAQGSPPPTIDELRSMLRADIVPGTYFVDLLASATTESDALGLVDAAAIVYRERIGSRLGKDRRDRIQNVEAVVRDLSKDIEQIDARCEAIIAKEKLTTLEPSPTSFGYVRMTRLFDQVGTAKEDRKGRIAAGASTEDLAVLNQVIDDLDTELRACQLNLESETQALDQLRNWKHDREEKVRMMLELQREVVRLRLSQASYESAYPAIRMLNKPRIRAAR
jgi:hypothetical protein